MTNAPVVTQIQLRYGTTAEWAAANPLLAVAEIGVELAGGDVRYKIGDGIRHWADLPYTPVQWSAIQGKPAVIAAGETAAAARAAIGAGTSSLAIGTTNSTAKAGNYAPSQAEVLAALGYTPENAAAKGVNNGYASLDSAGKIPASQLPTSIMEYQGTYNAATNSPTLADGTGNSGDVYRVSTAGSPNFGSGAITLRVGDYLIYNGSIWQKSATTDSVAAVAGLNGEISAAALKSALSLDQVDNTADLSKPISTAAQTALNGKEPSIAAGTTSQWLRGDKTWHAISKATVGLDQVDNTADLSKPISTAAHTALNGKQSLDEKDVANGYAGLNGSGQLTASTTGNAATATRLATARTINGMVPFDGSANVVTHNTGWMPVDYNWLAWAYDPIAATTSTASVAGTLYVSSIKIPAATTISNITLAVTANGVTPVNGQNFVGLYQNGNLLATSSDQSSSWSAPGMKTASITPQNVAAGIVQIAVLSNATSTQASFAGRGAPGARDILNGGLSGLGLRFATGGTGLTSMPSTLGSLTSSIVSLWVAVS